VKDNDSKHSETEKKIAKVLSETKMSDLEQRPPPTLSLTSPNRLTDLDPESFSFLVVISMLFNPEDGKPDNYVVERLPGSNKLRLIAIDNDHAFVPATASKKEGGVRAKSVLFCMEAMNDSVHPKVRARIQQTARSPNLFASGSMTWWIV